MTPRTQILGLTCLVALALAGSASAQPTSLPPPPPPVAAPTAVPLIPAEPPAEAAIQHSTIYPHQERCCGDLLVEGEYFLLAPRRGPLTYAIVGVDPVCGPVGQLRSLDGNYDSGFRVGAGWRFTEEEWDVMARYAYLNSKTNDGVAAPTGQKVFATLAHPSIVAQVASAQASGMVKFNLVDLELGRRFELGEQVGLRLFAGPRYANVEQQLTVTYAGGDVATDVVNRCLCFDGAGLRAGGETNLKVLESLGLYVRGSASLLTGRFSSRITEVANGSAVIVDVSDRFTRLVPMVDLGLGLSFTKENWRITAGYEFLNWFNMTDGTDFVDAVHPGKIVRPVGSLGFDGVVFRAEMSF